MVIGSRYFEGCYPMSVLIGALGPRSLPLIHLGHERGRFLERFSTCGGGLLRDGSERLLKPLSLKLGMDHSLYRQSAESKPYKDYDKDHAQLDSTQSHIG